MHKSSLKLALSKFFIGNFSNQASFNVGRNFSCTSTRKESTVLVEHNLNNSVRTITLNNPAKRNALSLCMIRDLKQALEWSPTAATSLRAIVLNANGHVFSAGHDLRELMQSSDQRAIFEECGRLMVAIRGSPVPVICQVNGLATAAGCQLAVSCDIVLATRTSTFSTPGANVGLFCSNPGVAVSRSANLKTAAYMVLTGLPITAQQALSSGLITQVVEDSDSLQAQTDTILEAILAKSASVLALGKRFFYDQINMDLSSAYSQGSSTMAHNLQLVDGRHGIESFIGKRRPNWTHSFERIPEEQ